MTVPRSPGVVVDAKTLRSHFEIPEDTLIGRFPQPVPQKPGSHKSLVAAKFYLFDTAVARYLRRVALTGHDGPDLFDATSYQRTASVCTTTGRAAASSWTCCRVRSAGDRGKALDEPPEYRFAAAWTAPWTTNQGAGRGISSKRRKLAAGPAAVLRAGIEPPSIY